MRAEHWIYALPLRLRSLFRRAAVERELDDELGYHVQQQTEQHIAAGMAPSAARTEALRALGGIERRKEEMRGTRGVSLVENLMRDIRFSLRMLRRTPGFTAVAVVTLAVGTGANAAIFTVVNAVLLRPLAYGDPGRLVVVQYRDQETAAPGPMLRWKAQSTRSFESMGAAQYSTPTLTGMGNPEQLKGLRLTADVLPMMYVRPLLGRLLLPDEAHKGRDRVVVLSYDFWRRRFASDSQVIGRALILDGVAHTVVGVMPRGFQFAPFWATHSEVFRPLPLDGLDNDFDGASLRVFGRMRPGISLSQARIEMTAIGAGIKRAVPDYDANLVVVPLQEKVVGSVTTTLWILAGAVTLVLLIACANVTHLQLMRANAREREMAMRLSLGASRSRVLQQTLTESLLLSTLGTAIGLALAVGGVRALVALAPPDIPRVDAIRMDPRVFVFMAVVATLAGVISGVVPALATMRVDPNYVLKDSGRGAGESRRRRRAGGFLVVSEIAMAVILLLGAGLMLRSVGAMVGADTGFDPRNVLAAQVAVRGTQHDSLPRRGAFYGDVIDRISALPGVESVSATNHLPLHGDYWRFTFNIDGQPVTRPEDQPRALFRIVRPNYFHTMGIPVLRGRDITTEDMINRSHVVLLDESAARRYWPNTDAIGQRISVNDPADPPEWFTVVGVVKDVRQANWSATHNGEMYYPYWYVTGTEPSGALGAQLHPEYMTVVARAHGAPEVLATAIANLVQGLDRDASVADVITMHGAMAEQVAEPKFYLLLLGGFAGTALLLAAVGVYGVISFGVVGRTREIGIRLALGAAQRDSFIHVVKEGIVLASVGAGAGIIGALVLTKYLRSMLYDVTPTDPATFIAVPLVLVCVAAAACYLPARRASGIHPMVVLRSE